MEGISQRDVYNRMTMSGLLGFGFLLLWFMTMVDGLLPQIEMVVFGGKVPVPTIVLKGVFLVFCFMAILLRQRLTVPSRVLYWWWLFIIYLLFNAIVLSSRFGYPFLYTLFSYNAYYFYLLAFPLVYAFRGTLREETVIKVLIWVFLPLAALGLVQHFSGKTLLPVQSSDGYFEVHSWNFYGQVRAFSLFSSAANFGHYLALVSGMMTVAWYYKRGLHRFFSFTLLLIALLTTYATLTRATYLKVVLTLSTAMMIARFRWLRGWLKYVAILYGLFGLFVAYNFAPLVSKLGFSSNLFLDDSLLIRYTQWAAYGGMWLSMDPVSALFGTGLIQNERFAVSQDILIDSVFIAVGLHIGIIGLLIFLGLMWSIWCEVAQTAEKHASPLTMGVAALFSAWLFSGVFGITITVYPITAILLVLTAPRSWIADYKFVHENETECYISTLSYSCTTVRNKKGDVANR